METENQYDSDGAVMNGYDSALAVWVVGGIVQSCLGLNECDCNGDRYATRAVKYLPGHEVRIEEA